MSSFRKLPVRISRAAYIVIGFGLAVSLVISLAVRPVNAQTEGETGTNASTGTVLTQSSTTGTTSTTRDSTADLNSDSTTNDNGVTGTSTESGLSSGEDLDVGLRPSKATLQLVNLDDGEEEFITVQFTRRIQELDDDPAAFFVQGFDADNTVQASTVKLDENDTKRVIVGFPSGTDLLSYTALGVQAGVVRDAEGEGNIPDTLRLGTSPGSTRGNTAAPELRSVGIDQSLDRIEYTFDEFLASDAADASADAGGFGYYLPDGEAVTGSSIISVDDNRVVVDFGDNANVEDAARVFVANAAVTDSEGDANVPTSLGSPTAVPDLQSAARRGGSNTQWTYTFDEPVQDPQASSFLIISNDGDQYEASTVRIKSPKVIEATFPEVRDFGKQISVAAVLDNAVTDLGTDVASNTIGSRAVGGGNNNSSGTGTNNLTAGPGLTNVTIEDQTGEVALRFDEKIDEDANASASSFHIITTSGSVIDADEVLVVNEDQRTVRLLFPESAAESAAAVTIETNAVVDLEGNGNLLETRVVGGGQPVLGASAGPGGQGGNISRRLTLGGGCTVDGFECN